MLDMEDLIQQHLRRLRLVCAAMVLSCAIYAIVVVLVPAPPTPPLAQADHLLWVFALLSLVNIVTLMPVYRAMMATPLSVYGVSQDPGPLLSAHAAAHIVAFARLEALAIFGLVLFFITWRALWFWVFAAVGVAGMALLWPAEEKVRALTRSAGPTSPT